VRQRMKPHTIRYERRRFKRYDMVTRDCRPSSAFEVAGESARPAF